MGIIVTSNSGSSTPSATSYATEQEVMDHTEAAKIVAPAVIKKHTLITKLSILSNFA